MFTSRPSVESRNHLDFESYLRLISSMKLGSEVTQAVNVFLEGSGELER